MNGKIENVDEIVKIVMENEDVSEAIRQAVMDKNLEMLKKQFAYEKGMKKGELKGSKAEKKQMAKKMKADNLPIDTIMKYTELSKNEIEKL
jgi:predicted transposase/invertase (TIGR01784 family)